MVFNFKNFERVSVFFSLCIHVAIGATCYKFIKTGRPSFKQTPDQIIECSVIIDRTGSPMDSKSIQKVVNFSKKGSEKLRKKANTTTSTSQDLTPDSFNEMPSYSKKAKSLGLEDCFTAVLQLTKSGQVKKIEILGSPHDELKRIVMECLKKWRYHSSKNLEDVSINVPIEFILENGL